MGRKRRFLRFDACLLRYVAWPAAQIKTIAEKTGAAGLMDLTSGSSTGECLARRSRERRASKDNFKVTLVFKDSTSADQVGGSCLPCLALPHHLLPPAKASRRAC